MAPQSSVGTVVKAGDEEDPIGLLTVLNTRYYSELQSLLQIRDFLLQHCPNEEVKTALQAVRHSPKHCLANELRSINTLNGSLMHSDVSCKKYHNGLLHPNLHTKLNRTILPMGCRISPCIGNA